MIDAIMSREQGLIRKYRIRSQKAKSEHIKAERLNEAKYHEEIVLLLSELKERRQMEVNYGQEG